MKGFGLGIRSKTLLVSLVLLTIPWAGYQYIKEMEAFLRQGQEASLIATARAVATALHDRPNLFNRQASFLKQVEEGRDLYARVSEEPIQLDGEFNDWQGLAEDALQYDVRNLISGDAGHRPDDLSFAHNVVRYDGYLYAFFQVTDDHVIYRPGNSIRIDRNDHLRIGVVDRNGEFQRYLVAPFGPGWVSAYQVDPESDPPEALRPEPRIQGEWKQTANGYRLEIRLPLSLLGPKLGFAIADVDVRNQLPETLIGTSGTRYSRELGTLLTPSPEIEAILKGLQRASGRIWVVDRHGRVLAQSGDLRNSPATPTPISDGSITGKLKALWHEVLYRWVLRPPREDFADARRDAARIQSNAIRQALDGQTGQDWRLTEDRAAVIMTAAHPVFVEKDILGAVLVEETTNAILTLRNQAMERLLTWTMLVFVGGGLTLLLFATRLSARIRRLSSQADRAVDAQGRVTGNIEASRARDEIGDLSRSMAGNLKRLQGYTNYLENMARRLSHELRTPIAVVRSSLDNLTLEPLPEASRRYIERAQTGVDRLNNLLTRISEATRLEQSLDSVEHEDFDLAAVIQGCVEGYREMRPDIQFEFERGAGVMPMNGNPDLIVQMLDKLIGNAIDFHAPDTPVRITLDKKGQGYRLIVANTGSLLPEAMQDRLFESMVSLRPSDKQQEPHLGLGLYIARLVAEHHNGQISAENLPDENGVRFIVRLMT